MSYPNQYAPPEQRFWQKVDASGDCWLWLGEKNRAGYGLFRLNTTPEGTRPRVGAHRWIWEYLIGPIPADYTIDHFCKNTSCVNPDHIEPVPHGVNLKRGNSLQGRNARKVTCPRGHWYSSQNTYQRRSGRTCRTCATDLQRQRRARRKAEGLVYQ